MVAPVVAPGLVGSLIKLHKSSNSSVLTFAHVRTYSDVYDVLRLCLRPPSQMEQSEGQPQQRSFSFKAVFRRGPEVPIADRIAAAEKEMYTLDQVCKEKRRQLRLFRTLGME